MSAKTLTLPQIAELAGVGYRTLKVWEERGLIEPSVRRSRGSGRPNIYTEHDAEVAVGLAALRARGLDMPALELVASAWRKQRMAVCPVCHSSVLLDHLQPRSEDTK